jgi:hypothetical protein
MLRGEARCSDAERLRYYRRSRMKFSVMVTLGGVLLFLQPGSPSGQENGTTKVFLLEDAGNSQWCAYHKKATWNSALQDAGAMTVGTLTYTNDRLLQIDVTETDESGDWTVYDHYFLNGRGEVVKLHG